MRSQIRRFGAVASSAVALLVFLPSAQAVVQVTGNVWLSPDATDPGYDVYADDPFTTTVNEGIPTNGNRIDPFRSPTAQIEFEGRPDLGAVGIGDDTNVNFDIIVGRTSSGEMIINQSQLRDQNLIIGDQATIGSVIKRGTGVVRIEGFGSLYNNDPTIIPFLGPTQDPDNPTSPSVVPRLDTIGFDLFVGRFGNGVMQLALGGRAEIQDAAIVGDQSGSVGTLLIDGIDSFLQSGGFETDDTAADAIHYMIVGRMGSGTMTIANGGQSYNSGPVSTSGGGGDVFGAVIGSNLAAVNTDAPDSGGQGTVYVDGISSKWTVGGTLQIGGFHNNRTGVGPAAPEDLEGNQVQYFAGTGRGTLRVSNGALVSIVPPALDESATDVPDRLDLLVGHFGRIELDGGRMELLGAFDSTNPQNPIQRLTRGRLINDGVVAGSGSISVLQFRNRVLGNVRVGAGQKLLVDATGVSTEVDNIPLPGEQEHPLSNYGVIDVLGTEDERAEIEFRRGPGVTTAPIELNRPFLNLPVAGPIIAPNGRTEGLIHGQNSTMRFRSGLWNRGVLAFTQGSNVVSGDVISFGDSAPGADDHGRVVIGPDTNVAFEDDFFSLGLTQISPGSTFEVLKGNSFAVGGTFSITVEGSSTGLGFDAFQITGDASFSGNLQVSFTNGSLIPPFSSVPLFNVGGSISGNFSTVTPSGLPFGSPIDFFTFVFSNQLYLAAFQVPPIPLPGDVNPDLNGDGFVDDLDYAIWRQNFGTPGPAGDANGDGIVDASDYTIWRDNCCGTFPGAGGGSGAGFGLGGTVPEPASIALLACGGMLALAVGRRRSS